MMDERGGLLGPGFTDGLLRSDARYRLRASGNFVGRDEVGEVLAKPVVTVVVGAFGCGILDNALQPA